MLMNTISQCFPIGGFDPVVNIKINDYEFNIILFVLN